MDPATSEPDELQEVMKALGLSFEDAVLYLENALEDIAGIFIPTSIETSPPEPIPVHVVSA